MKEKYPCDAYDFLLTQKESLGKHKQAVLEGKKYPCDACNFFVSHKVIIGIHIQTVHEGKVFM